FQGQCVLDLLPLSTHESPVLLATPNRSGLRPSFPAWPICCSAFRPWSASLALPTARPNTPSADFCPAVRRPLDRLSRQEATRSRSPGVSSIAFGAQPPDLRFAPLMDMDFAIRCPVVRRLRLVSGFCPESATNWYRLPARQSCSSRLRGCTAACDRGSHIRQA